MICTKEKSIVALFKGYMLIIIVLIAVVSASLFSILFMAVWNNTEDSTLINVLGRQRMLTQMMAKDANRIYAILDVMNSNTYEDSRRSELNGKLIYTMENLQNSEEEYGRQCETICKGYIINENKRISFEGDIEALNPILKENKEIWEKFRVSTDAILGYRGDMQSLTEALKYINENNEQLLKNNEDITNIVTESVRQKSTYMLSASIAVSVLALILLIIFFVNIYKNLFVPVNQLYKGMAEVGITALSIETPEVKRQELLPIFSEVKRVFDKLNSLIALIENINKNISFKDELNYIYNSFSQFIPYTHIGVALIEDDGQTIRASYGVSSKHHENLPKRLVGYEANIQETSLGKILETGQERVINDLEEYLRNKPVKEYNRVLLDEGIRSSITFPLKNNNNPAGIIFFSSNIKNIYKKEHVEFLRTIANSILLSLEKSIFIDDMIIGSIQALAKLAEQRDSETGEHIQRMKTYSRAIAEVLSGQEKYREVIDMDYIIDIERFSPLHDIGKVGIRDDILLKPGKLTREEFEIMKTHTLYGAWVLKTAEENIKKKGRNIFSMGIEIAEGHHEKWDGTGYPYGKSGTDIPLSARIVAAADVLDALTSKRPYKEAYSFEESIDIIVKGSGKHFDPDIANIFVEHNDSIKQIYDAFKSKEVL